MTTLPGSAKTRRQTANGASRGAILLIAVKVELKIYVPGRYWSDVDIFRQTPKYSGRFNGCLFHNDIKVKSDYIVMAENNEDWKLFPKEKRIFITMENPNILRYTNEYIERAGILITPFKEYLSADVNKIILSQPAIPWFYGIDFDTSKGVLHQPIRSNLELSGLTLKSIPKKNKLISCISSAKAVLPGHKWRREIAHALKNYFIDDCDIFGFGFKPVNDKKEALDDYLFSVVIENQESDHYWTEKLSDCLLGGAMPIYSGASKVNQYFPMDIPLIRFGEDPENAVSKISKIINSFDTPSINNLIDLNRQKILFSHNIFSILSRIE